MKSPELLPSELQGECFQPSSPQELVDKALSYIEPDGTIVRRDPDTGLPYREFCSKPFDLDSLPVDAWSDVLRKVAVAIYRRTTAPSNNLDVDGLQRLAKYLSAYRHDMAFLYTACSLIEVANAEKGYWRSPQIPDTAEDRYATLLLLRQR